VIVLGSVELPKVSEHHPVFLQVNTDGVGTVEVEGVRVVIHLAEMARYMKRRARQNKNGRARGFGGMLMSKVTI
jgi:hypothetical protein